jgi:solute carrier family 25 (mitochondrial carnitine/acylcarnitine transporter), member 20/29
VGGVCAVLTGHPFDLVKVNLQTAEKGTYTGAIDVVRKIVARQGASVCIQIVEWLERGLTLV